MPDPKLDELLLDFLREQQESRRRGVTLESIAITQRTLADSLIDHAKEDADRFDRLHEKLDTRLSSHDHRITHVEAQLENAKKDIERVEESTGSHNVPEILRAARGNGSGRPPQSGLARAFGSELAKGVAKGLGVLLLLGLGWCAHQVQQLTVSPSNANASSSK